MALATDAHALLKRLRGAGIKVELADERLVVRAGKGAMTTELADEVKGAKGALVELLRDGALRAERLAAIPRYDDAAPAPLTHTQEQLWVAESFHPGVFNMATGYLLPGAVDMAAFAQAIRRLQSRHRALRCAIEMRDGVLVQVARPTPCRPIVVDLTALGPDAGGLVPLGVAARGLIGQAVSQAFALEQAPLLRLVVVRAAGEVTGILIVMHHLVADGWSLRVIERDFGRFYAEALAGGAPAADAHDGDARDLFDFAAWQRRWTDGVVGERHRRFWLERLAHTSGTLDLPRRRPRAGIAWQVGSVRRSLDAGIAQRLRAAAAEAGLGRFPILFAAWAMMLSEVSRKPAIALATPLSGRDQPALRDAVGCFVNTAVIRCDCEPELRFATFAHRMNQALLDAADFQNLPPDAMPELRSFRRDGYEAMLSLLVAGADQGGTGAAAALPDGGGAFAAGRTRLERDFCARLSEHEDGVDVVLDYASELYDPGLAQSMVETFAALLDAALAHPRDTLGEIAARAARARVATPLRGEALPVEVGDLADILDRRLAATPDAAVLSCDRRTLSAQAVRDRVDALAHRLVSHDAGPESLVGLCVSRSLALPVVVYAVWRAGAAYAPVSADWPDARILAAFALTDTRLVVCDADQVERFARLGFIPVAIDPDTAREPAGVPASTASTAFPVAHPRNLAYVIFTSGSSGVPKAVAIERGAVVNLITGVVAMLGAGPGARGTLASPIIFDASVEELLGPHQGFSLRVLRQETLLDALLLGRELSAMRQDLLTCTPTLLGLLIDHGPQPPCLPGTCVVGGEAMPSQLWRSLGALPLRAINSYGPTEFTVDATFAHVVGERPHVGRPMANHRADVLDRRLRPRPQGSVGELCLAGPGVARGYVGRPDLTADRFRPDPAGAAGARLYRTGDLAALRVDGDDQESGLVVDIIGRADNQLKIRGFRIEPLDVEGALVRHPLVRAARVDTIEAASGEPLLAAFLQFEASVPLAELRAHCERLLPAYMVPAAFLVLERFPQTSSGKFDRRAAIAIASEVGNTPPATTAPPATVMPPVATPPPSAYPRGPQIAPAILAIVAGVLDRKVSPDDDFYSLGGSSLSAMRIAAKLRSDLGLEVTGIQILAAKTLGDLVTTIAPPELDAPAPDAAAGAVPDAFAIVPPAPARVVARGPASFNQQQLWLLDQLGASGAVYSIPTIMRISAGTDHAALLRSLNHIVRRHDVLLTRYELNDEGALDQVVESALPIGMPVIDITGMPAALRPRVVHQLVLNWRHTPFDLGAVTQFRAALVRTGDETDLLFVNVHHIAFDGWSFRIFLMELQELFSTYLASPRTIPADPLPPMAQQYLDFARWQRALFSKAGLDRYVDYWRKRLGDLPPLLELPVDRARPRVSSYRGGLAERTLAADAPARLDELARSIRTTPFIILITSFFIFLSRLTGRSEVVTGTPYANRTTSDVEGVIGYFVNTVAVRADIDGTKSFRELVKSMHGQVLDDFIHQDLPFEEIVNRLRIPRVAGASPVFQTLFTADVVPEGAEQELVEHDLKIADYAEDKGVAEAKFDLSVSFDIKSTKVGLALSYCLDLFDHASGQAIADRYLQLLDTMFAAPDVPVGAIDLTLEQEVPPQGESRLVGPQVAGDERDLADRLAGALAHAPDAIVLSCGARQLSAAAVDERSAAIADTLAALGAGPDVPIAVCMRRTLALPLALVATWRAAAAYLPVDPDLPDARIAQTLADAGVTVAIAEPTFAERLRTMGYRVLVVDPDTGRMIEGAVIAPAELVRPRARPDNLAYILFTSGSTGRPKGVAVTRANLANLLDVQWATGLYGKAGETRVSLNSTFTFDVSLQQLGELLRGNHVRVLTNAQRIDGIELDRQLRGYRLGLFECTPSQLIPLLADSTAPRKLPAVLLVAGEALPAHLWTELTTLAPQVRAINAYGPTEFTVYSTWTEVSGSEPMIGRPVGNCTTQVLTSRLKPAAPGTDGELCLSGPNVVRGYAGRPDLTADAFRPDPGGLAGSRLYRTGDVVRLRQVRDGIDAGTDGLEMIGRIDQQMKLRGYRIEAGEVEAALRRHDAVRAAVVMIRQTPSGDRRLVAFVTLSAAGEAVAGDWAALVQRIGDACRQQLPAYMCPSHIQRIAALPLTPSGKLDRKALPEVAWHGGDSEVEASHGAARATADPVAAPASEQVFAEAGEAMAAIWAGMLSLPTVGLDDDFFALGGSSLLAMHASARIRNAFALDIRATDILAMPTVRQLASKIAEGAFAAAAPPLKTVLSEQGAAPAPDRAPTITERVIEPAPSAAATVMRGPQTGSSMLRPLRQRADARALAVFVHAASGQLGIYRQLVEALDGTLDVDIVGIESPLLKAGNAGSLTLSQQARAATAQLVVRAAGRPVHLLGWSYGGLIAHELAVRLDLAGQAVASLTLLDAHTRETSERVREFELAEVVEEVIGNLGLPLPQRYIERLREGEGVAAILAEVAAHPHMSIDFADLEHAFRVMRTHLVELARHTTRHYEGKALLIRAMNEPYPPCAWDDHVAALTTADFHVGHAALLTRPTINLVAALVGAQLRS